MTNIDHIEVGLTADSLAVERCVEELRRGRPVALSGSSGERSVALMETLTDKQYSQFTANGPCHLLVTRERAEVAGLTVDSEVCCLVLNPDTPLEKLRWIVGLSPDPNTLHTLSDPLLCNPLETIPAPAMLEYAAAGLTLARQAHVLPALIMCASDNMISSQLEVQTHHARNWVNPSGELLKLSSARIPLATADSVELTVFREKHGNAEHVAIMVGQPDPADIVTVRLHSSCYTGDILGSLRCDCGEQLQGSIASMAGHNGGVILYVSQEGRGIGLSSKLLAYQLQDQGLDTIEANQSLGFAADERRYQSAATMLRSLGIGKIQLMTNNPEKIEALNHAGINVVGRVASPATVNEHNARYLETKRSRAGHLIPTESLQ